MQDQSHLLPYARRSDFHVGRATELTGRARVLYRVFEILPGLASWSTLIGVILMSIYAPFIAAYFIIAFALFWVLKTGFLSYHLRYNWKRLQHHTNLDWEALIADFSYDHLHHVIILPFYTEPASVIEATLQSLAHVKYDKQKLVVVLASEARAGEYGAKICADMTAKWGSTFGVFLTTTYQSARPTGDYLRHDTCVHF